MLTSREGGNELLVKARRPMLLPSEIRIAKQHTNNYTKIVSFLSRAAAYALRSAPEEKILLRTLYLAIAHVRFAYLLHRSPEEPGRVTPRP